jgi:NAD(P)-dependent dehydrogenase (short-subunit alcohol dehydrogenase family)
MAVCQWISKRDDISSGAIYVVFITTEEAMQIADKNALITGGSRGLGRALAEELARAGARVVLVAREAEALDRAVAEIRAAGGQAHGITADIGDKQAIYRIAGQAAALVGAIDILVHDASTLGPTPLPLLLDTECEDLERIFQVNVIGPFRLTRALAGAMALRAAGVIVHISSDAGVEAYPRWGGYGASKAALDHLSRTWAAELEGVRVFSVDPGEMDTAMHAAALPDADPATLARPADVARRIAAMIADPVRAPSGARLVASAWPPAPLPHQARAASAAEEARV